MKKTTELLRSLDISFSRFNDKETTGEIVRINTGQNIPSETLKEIEESAKEEGYSTIFEGDKITFVDSSNEERISNAKGKEERKEAAKEEAEAAKSTAEEEKTTAAEEKEEEKAEVKEVAETDLKEDSIFGNKKEEVGDITGNAIVEESTKEEPKLPPTEEKATAEEEKTTAAEEKEEEKTEVTNKNPYQVKGGRPHREDYDNDEDYKRTSEAYDAWEIENKIIKEGQEEPVKEIDHQMDRLKDETTNEENS